MENRKNNYDLLRVIAMIAVITLHISGVYATAATSSYWLGVPYTKNILITSIYRCLSSFAVPVFIMLSGAFALDNPKNRNYRYYYRKEFTNIGVTTLVISFLYLMYGLFRDFVTGLISNRSTSDIILRGANRVKEFIIGSPFYHLWYLYMMIGVFILVPVVIRIKEDVGEVTYKKCAVIFFVIATLGLHMSTHELMWDPGFSFGFLGYFMMGYVIRKNAKEDNLKASMLIIAGVLVLVSTAYFISSKGIDGVGNKDLLDSLTGASTLPVAISSILIFDGFSRLNVKKEIMRISKQSFLVYLFHAGVWDVLSIFITKDMDRRIVIPLAVIIVFALSWIISIIWQWIWRKLEDRWCLSIKLCKFLRLEG